MSRSHPALTLVDAAPAAAPDAPPAQIVLEPEVHNELKQLVERAQAVQRASQELVGHITSQLLELLQRATQLDLTQHNYLVDHVRGVLTYQPDEAVAAAPEAPSAE